MKRSRERWPWIGGLLALSLLLVAPAREGVAVDVEHRPLKDAVRDAYIVARVRITSREPVLFEFEGQEEICGYRYRAEVTRSYKGPQRSFEFFASDPRDSGGIGKEHLVIASQLSLELRRSLTDTGLEQLEGVHQKRYLCVLSTNEIFVPDGDQMLIPFDERARETFGEDEWLRVSRLSVVSDYDYEMRKVEPGGTAEPYPVVRWSDVEKTIRKALQE